MIDSSPPTDFFHRPPSIVCSGFLDSNGFWNNGFACPKTNFVQYFCCGKDENLYCCSPDRYKFESSAAVISSSTILTTTFVSTRQQPIDRQFEQFQNYFLPVFLLTTTILLLIGIALWFWLYKHKAFYAIERENVENHSSVV